ncbi:MAG: carbamoyl-phosphate synthase large subunit [Chloroflexi bacterium]|nr:carbamoyl-phosphate synthase large subunit [Chloroflexota bacterium]
MGEKDSIRKVLVIGSGPIVIGQAAEFDYAGTQACKALREEGVISVLVNSNPATIMTDQGVADVVYIEPLTVEVLARIIERERPDGLLPTLGGQTGLNLAVDLADAGVLDRFGVRLLGTPLETIKKAEDRELFKNLLREIDEPVPLSKTVYSLNEARDFLEEVGLPVVIRPAYTLGGTGGGIAHAPDQFERIVSAGIEASPIGQVLLERCLLGWKEIEYEVMRDAADTCITICNMENFDPMGVHTGDSIVVAPSQTLSDKEYQMLRTASIKIIRALGIEGGCNIQFGLDPRSMDYCVIEVNPRVSRSSALASKATGYPIARVAAKIAVGRRLDEITNAVTGKTTAAFEPALDYCVVKIPRWPFDKFPHGDRSIGTQMKATGEVMAIDRSFEAALQKAVRALELGGKSLLWEDHSWTAAEDTKGQPAFYNTIRKLWGLIEVPNDQRLWAITAALRRGVSIKDVGHRTGIDPWFLTKIRNIVAMERKLLEEPLTPDLLLEAKRLGFSDAQIATLADRLPEQVRQLRRQWSIYPVFKTVDTCAAEFEAATPYYYSTYESENEAIPIDRAKACVIGSGPIRIGQGIEFDYCSVHSAWALRDAGVASIMINSNPETVSTDFDTSSRLYFEALDEESVRDILENEGLDSAPAIVQFGGQTAINLAEPLKRGGSAQLGSSTEAIDLAEDRRLFENFLNRLGIPQPPGGAVTTVEEALNVAQAIGYPVLVRPSYVLGGRAMEICHNATELVRYVGAAAEFSSKHPILVDKYLEGKEVEVDAVCDGSTVLIPGVMEHIERAGVHSGDSMAVYPGINLTSREVETIVDYTTQIGLGLEVRGLVNIQYVIFQDEVYVLEVNPRSSRTVPFLSKVTGVPMVKIATLVMLGTTLAEQGYEGGLWKRQRLVAVKAPVFSMSKLLGVDTYLGPEMKSTGEVMGVDFTFEAALAKALLAAKASLPPEGAVLLSIADKDKPESLPIIRQLAAYGFKLCATEGTATMIEAIGLPVKMITKKLDHGHPNVLDVIRDGLVQGVVNTIGGDRQPMRDGFAIRRAAVEKGIPCFTSLDTFRAVLNSWSYSRDGYNVLPIDHYLDAGVSQ